MTRALALPAADASTPAASRREWDAEELLASHRVEAPLIAAGRRCHGGFDEEGIYRSPRTLARLPAIATWQAEHRADFATDLLDVPVSSWPEPFPNVAQAKLLLRAGVREPIVTILTRIGTVEGFGAMIRHAGVGDPQRFFAEPVAGTALAHLDRGLFEAHARDEAGHGDEAGHRDMWFAARDVAFEDPVTEDETARMLERMGLAAAAPGAAPPDPSAVRQRIEETRRFSELDLGLEMLVARMIGILLIEISAFHTFAWAEAVLADTELAAGDGAAARIVAYIRQDETPHVEYLKTALTEMRDRTFIGDSGRKLPGRDVVGALWERGLAESLGPRREQQHEVTRREIERAVSARRDADDLLAEIEVLGGAA